MSPKSIILYELLKNSRNDKDGGNKKVNIETRRICETTKII